MTWWKWPLALEYWLWCVRKCGVCSGQHCSRLIVTCSIIFSSCAGRIQMLLSKLLWGSHINEHLSCLLWMKIQSDSYNTKVIFAWMIRSGWNLLQKHCVFMPVSCVSNLQWPEQMGLSGTHCYCVGLSCTALWERYIILCALWLLRLPDLKSPDYFFWGWLEEWVYRNKPLAK